MMVMVMVMMVMMKMMTTMFFLPGPKTELIPGFHMVEEENNFLQLSSHLHMPMVKIGTHSRF